MISTKTLTPGTCLGIADALRERVSLLRKDSDEYQRMPGHARLAKIADAQAEKIEELALLFDDLSESAADVVVALELKGGELERIARATATTMRMRGAL